MLGIWTRVNTHVSAMALSRSFNQEYINITTAIIFILYLLLLLHVSNIVRKIDIFLFIEVYVSIEIYR